MNLKTKVAILAAAAASTALAVSTDNTLCRIAVSSGAKSTIVALPLKNVGGTEAQILVTNLVMTTGLATGDKLLYWNANKGTTGDWDAWEVSNNAWVPVESTGGETPSASTANLPCGSAVWIQCNQAKTIYLFGQYFTSGATTTVVAGKSTLVGPCAAADFPVNSLKGKKTAGSFVQGDKIQLVDSNNTRLGLAEYVWRGTSEDGQFKKLGISNGEPSWSDLSDSVVIPAGQGFWYVSKGGNPTFTW